MTRTGYRTRITGIFEPKERINVPIPFVRLPSSSLQNERLLAEPGGALHQIYVATVSGRRVLETSHQLASSTKHGCFGKDRGGRASLLRVSLAILCR